MPDVVKEYVKKYPKPFTILDESSKIKTNRACRDVKKSKRTVAIQKLNKYGHRSILTGTFLSKSPVNAYDQMEFLQKGFFEENMYQFESKYVITITLPIGRGCKTVIPEDVYAKVHKRLNKAYKEGGSERLQLAFEAVFNAYKIGETKQRHIMDHEEYTPFINVKDLYARIAPVCMVVRKHDALDMPAKTYVTRKVCLTKEMADMYKELLSQGFTEELTVDNTLSLYHRFQDICNGYIPFDNAETGKVELKRQAENVKLDELLETIDEIGSEEHQIVVFANRTLFLEDIHKAVSDLGIPCALYNGNTSSEDKAKIKEDCTSGKVRVFIANQASAAYGLDFLKGFSYELFVSNDHSVERREQAEDRIHRGEHCGAKTIIDIVVEGTVDEKVTRSLLLGKELIKAGKTDKSLFDLF